MLARREMNQSPHRRRTLRECSRRSLGRVSRVRLTKGFDMITDLGALRKLEALRYAFAYPAAAGVSGFLLVLFKAALTPSRSLLWSSVSSYEADFTGYGRINCDIPFVNAAAIWSSTPRLLADEVTFSLSSGSDQTVYGFGIVSVDGGGAVVELVQAKNFSVPKTLSVSDPDCAFTPYLGDIPI